MVIVHTTHMVTQDKVKALADFTVIPTVSGLMVHGPAEQVVEKIRAIGEETGAEIVLDVFDGGECKHYAFNDTPSGSVVEKTAEEPAVEQPAELPAAEPAAAEEIVCEEQAIIEEPAEVESEPDETEPDEGEVDFEDASDDDTEDEPEEPADEEAPAEDNPEAAPAPEAKTPAKPAAPKQEVTFKDHKERIEPPLLPVPDTDFTAEDAIKKLESDKHFLCENASDCLYVLDQLSERCKTDRDFCQYVMRDGKTFIGSYKYLATLAKNDFVGMIVEGLGGKMVDLSREAAIPYFVEYFMLNDDEIARLKKEEEEKKKAERAAAAAAKAAKTRKKNEKDKGRLAGRIEKKEDPGLLAGIKIPDVPKAESPKPAPAPAKPAAPVAKETPAQSNEQLDMFAMMGMAV